ncbi:MAG TPA: adenylate/guanylate cyclase domain-containing protein [Methylomirabilota bacterium]|nr:adenylate/guanylate cyclase domain-containing protein [Methylomirabilota bacterium]
MSVPGAKFDTPNAYTPLHLAERILTSKAALEGERKQVTVLFADLKGSMELLADRDPEDARRLLDPVLERMMEAVHRYEGTVNQVMGDGIMALFGAPIAHEDHAVRACYAALAMQETIRRYTEEILRTHGITLQIRVGLNSGEVLVRTIGNDLHMDYSAVGQTVHLAARMEQLAPPGSIWQTAETLRLVDGLVQVTSRGLVPIKGLPGPMEVFELTGASANRGRLQAAVARGLTRFVGRQTETEALRQALERASAGHGQVVAVVGEPGVGKTRLFYEFIHSHRTQGWLALEATSMSYGQATTYLPIIDLLKVYFRIEEGDDRRRIREKVTGKLLTLDEALRPTLPAFLSLLEVPVEDGAWEHLDALHRRQHSLDAVKRLLLRESQVQPLILVFENLHWIDSETQALLDRLVESLPTARLLLLVNYRPEYQHNWGSKTYYIQLRLDPLPPENAGELLQDLLGEDASLEALKGRLIEWTEGNPFFLEETLQTLVETHALVGARGAYRLVKPLGTIQVPATVQAVLAARIDRLPLEEKHLLQTAAVIGKDVPYTLLQTIVALPETALHRGLDHLQAAEFLYETSLFPEIEYTFKHALTQQVAYGSLLHERQRVLHRRAGEELERLSQTQPEEPYEKLAYHYSRSDQTGKAVEYLVKAGHKATHRYANREALDHFQKALELIPTGEAYDRVLESCAELLLGLFRGKEAASAYEQLLVSARQCGNRTQELTSLLGLAQAYYIVTFDEPDFGAQSLELGKQAYVLARQLDDKRSMVRILLRRVLYLLDFDPDSRDDTAASCAEASALSLEIGDEDLIIDSSYVRVVHSSLRSGPTAEIEQQGEELLKRLEMRHDLLRLKEQYFRLMQLHRSRGNFARCIECCDAGIRLAADIGALPVMYPTEKAYALLYLGRYDEAWASLQREIADEAHQFARMIKDLCTGRYFLEIMAYEKASAVLEPALDQASRLQRWRFALGARLLLAASIIRAGHLEPTTLSRLTQDLLSILEGPSAEPSQKVTAAQVMAELLLSEGRLDEALRRAEASARHADQIGFKPAYVSALALQLCILLRLNRPTDVVVLADSVLAVAEAMSYRPMLWRIRAAKAQALATLGNGTGAAEESHAAAAVIRELSETIPDEELKRGFLARASIMTGTHDDAASERG